MNWTCPCYKEEKENKTRSAGKTLWHLFFVSISSNARHPCHAGWQTDYMSTFYIKLNTEAKLQYYSSSKQIVSIVVSPSPALPTVLYSAGHVTIYLSALWLPFKRNNSQLDTSRVVELELPGAGFFGAAPVPEPIFWSKAAPAASFWKAKRKMKEPVPEPA